MTCKSQRRRGVLLLVVLSMLVVFGLIAITFVMVANQEKNAAKAISRAHSGMPRADSAARWLVDGAMRDLLRDTNNPTSVIRGHSLLRDMYGSDGFVARVWWMPDLGNLGAPAWTSVDGTRGQLIDLVIYDDPTDPYGAHSVDSVDGVPWPLRLSRVAGYYNGRVLTIVDGSAAGTSTRIVDYDFQVDRSDPTLGAGRFRVLAFPNAAGRLVTRADVVHPVNLSLSPSAYDRKLNARVVVNGPPFNGSGFGYNESTGKCDWHDGTKGRDGTWGTGDDVQVPTALIPNRASTAQNARPLFGPLGSGAHDVGGADESYDTADFQNLALAYQPVPPAEDDSARMVIPSFHRPALINYWFHQMATGSVIGWQGSESLEDKWQAILQPYGLNGIRGDGDDPGAVSLDIRDEIVAFKRRISLRPIKEDHPHFTGSNLASRTVPNPAVSGTLVNPFWERAGHWDVDNDGDSVRDSVWIDLGYPAQRAADGQLYKPLFAILCQDLDGRLNLNAHGTEYDVQFRGAAAGPPPPLPAPLSRRLAGADDSVVAVPRGQGYGPPEISLLPLFSSPGPASEYDLLLRSRYAQTRPGVAGADIRAQIKFFGFPDRYDAGQDPTFFASPPNLLGCYGIGLDYGGVPSFEIDPASTLINNDSPYELDLSPSAPRGIAATDVADMPFSIAELEPLLRIYDADAPTLKSRLWDLNAFNSTSAVAARNRHVITTESWDLPAPNVSATKELFTSVGLRTPQSIVDLLRARLAAAGLADTAETFDDANGNGRHDPGESFTDTNGNNRHDRNLLDAQIEKMLPQALRMGLRADVNQPFGNGRDDDVGHGLNGVADEPSEAMFDGEPFEDANRNGFWDSGEDFVDLNGNSTYNAGGGGEPFTDTNANGHYDFGENFVDHNENGLYDAGGGEPYVDANGNGIHDNGESYTDLNGNNEYDSVDALWRYQFGNCSPSFHHTGSTDVNDDGVINAADRALVRQLHARYLYVLMMLLTDTGCLHPPQLPTEGLTDPVLRELTARRIAQWAINVVDFRDPDSIMTPFEYDVEPFDGWMRMDGEPGTDEGGDRRLVWGCEEPVLLLTETLALHDRRVEDTPVGNSRNSDTDAFDPNDDDNDLDQARIPRGGAWFELYCTANRHNRMPPRDLFTADGRLGLDRKLPTSLGPVWRLAISRSRNARVENDVLARFQQHPTTTELGPENLIVAGDAVPTADQIEIDRIVWFTRVAPDPAHPHVDRIYYNRDTATSPLLDPGRYAVVGPREDHRIGWDQENDTESRQLLKVRNTDALTVDVRNNDGSSNYIAAAQIRQVLGIVAAANVPASWTDAGLISRGIGISVSEPLRDDYYPAPDQATPNGIDAGVKDSYVGVHDQPFDSAGAANNDTPLANEGLLETGTTDNYRTVFVQRLANPLLRWNPLPGRPGHDPAAPVNPYITVDWMPIDLTVFNSQDRQPNYPPAPPAAPNRNDPNQKWNRMRFTQSWDPDDPDADDPALIDDPANFSFASRQRGRTGADVVPRNIWSTLHVTTSIEAASDDPPDTQPLGSDDFVLRHALRHTLGFLNHNFHPIIDPVAHPENVGDPDGEPFPWLTWNNRPFVSQYELMLVPSSAPGRLLSEYSTSSALNPYTGAKTDFADFRAPFGHLLNFFNTSTTVGNSPNFYRLFEYVHVPSRFVGTETVLDPVGFSAGAGTAHLQAPFNRLSTYREPGRVNVNTIADEVVWNGIKSDHPGPLFASAAELDLADSRRGYGAISDPILVLNPNFPTFFANPFRSPFAGEFVPLTQMERHGVECTLLRSTSMDENPAERPLLGGMAATPYNNGARSPYFRYAPLTRLGNLVTTRSNVHAVWITVGFFGVEPADPAAVPSPADFNRIYPDGYWLREEVGSDQGAARRLRAFYIIDRSIPVAFEPGADHNVDNAVLLRRFVE